MILAWLLPLLILIIPLVLGCSVAQPKHGWHPETKSEMRQLIGQTTMEAIYQFNQALIKELNKGPSPDEMRSHVDPV